jgi:hypothetical protein
MFELAAHEIRIMAFHSFALLWWIHDQYVASIFSVCVWKLG